MGRKRKDNPLKLPDRTYFKHGRFWYVHRTNDWEDLGTDLAEAKRKGNHLNDPQSTFGTMAWYLDAFVVHCEKRVGLPKSRNGLSPRTYEDYKQNAEPLKAYFGKMSPSSVKPHHVRKYLDLGIDLDRAIRANREKACLSTCFTWMIGDGESGVTVNPCIGVKRNPEQKRERYISHDEYDAVYQLATRQVRGLMALIYRTLQRPGDILKWTRHNIVVKAERRVLRFRQGKTGAWIEIIVSEEMDAILTNLASDNRVISGMTLIHNNRGQPYTEDGISSMFRRYVNKAKLKDFALYDLKGKGATDMWLAGMPLEKIQLLCGHDSVTTTEIYVKCRWTEPVEANKVQMKSSNKETGSQ